MFKDLKKFLEAKKIREWRPKVLPEPYYHDGLEPLFQRIHPGHQWVKVSDIMDLSSDTKLFRLVLDRPGKMLAPFRAGSYIGVTVNIDGVVTSRPYSLVSSPNQLGFYEIGVKKKEGGFVSHYFDDRVKVGDRFQITEPMGNLYYNPLFHGQNLVFIAGGCGVTPFISLLRDISERVLDLNVWLVFGCLTENDMLFREELEDIAARRPNIKITFVLSEPSPSWTGAKGFISKDIIKKAVGRVDDKYFFVVGNRNMYTFVLGELEALGLPQHKIISEAFGVPEDITQIPGWPLTEKSPRSVKVKVQLLNRPTPETVTIEASCNEPLLNSLERAKIPGLLVDTGCRSGECALCRTQLLSGSVFVPPEVHIRERDHDFGFIHPCISYPLEDLELKL